MRERFRERGVPLGKEESVRSSRRSGALESENRRDRLQPYLLDRLTDDAPTEREEGGGRKTATLSELRRRLLRDLEWLLNTRLRDEEDSSLAGRELALKSVIRFGVEDMSGRSVMRLSGPSASRRLETAIRDAIKTYEPRIAPNTLRVRLIREGDQHGSDAHHLAVAGQIVIEIAGEMFCQPANQPLLVRTRVDLESGDCEVGEA